MKTLYKKFVARYQKREFGRTITTQQLIDKNFRIFSINLRHTLKDLVLLTIGFFCAGFGLKSFLLPNHFIDGGVTGISLIFNQITILSLPLLIILINIPFIILGYLQLGLGLALKSIFAIGGLALVLIYFPYPIITSDKLLVAAFGGLFLGAGIGFSVRGGGVLDGTEVLALYLSKKLGTTLGDIILVFNIIIFLVAVYVFSVEIAMYSILTYFSASKTVDFIIEGVEEYIGITIVSNQSDEMMQMIIEKMGRGVTIYKGKRGFGKRGESRDEIDIVYTVMTRLEIGKLKSEIEIIDPNSFVTMSSVKDTKGGMVKKRPFAH